jgi:hypothetical protein
LARNFQNSGKSIGAGRTGLGIAARGYAPFQAPDQDKADLAASPLFA